MAALDSIPFVAGFEGGRAASRAQEDQQRQNILGALQAYQALDRVRRESALRQAYQQHADDPEALAGALTRLGDVNGAAAVLKMGNERGFQKDLRGALNPDGTIDDSRMVSLALKRGQVGPALSFASRADAARTKAEDIAQRRAGVAALAGTPEVALTGDDDGNPIPAEDRKTIIPRKAGALDAYANSPNQAVRRQAAALQSALESGVLDPKEAMHSIERLGYSDVSSGEKAADRQARADREAGRMSDVVRWDSKRGVGITRSGAVVAPDNLPEIKAAGSEPKAQQYAKWRIETLVSSGVPLEEARQIVAGGAPMQVGQATIARLANGLMKLTEDDMVTPKYKSLGEAMQAVRDALGEDAKRTGRTPTPAPVGGALPPGPVFPDASAPAVPAPAAGPAVTPATGSTALQPGLPAGSKKIGTSKGRPVYQAPDGKRYVVEE